MKRRIALALLVLAGVVPVAATAQSAYPDKPIKLIVPFSQGTALDLVARMIAEGLTTELNNPVVVENRIGASGIIGTELVAKAAPDGYTLLFTAPPHYINQFVYKSIPYEPVKDFRPVTKISNAQLALVVGKDSRFSGLAQVIDHAKAHPNALRYSSSGQGGTIHLAFSLLNSMANIKVEHVPYKSGAQALTDVIAGHIDITFTAVASALPHSKGGTLKLLGVSGSKRSRAMAEVPTISEAGIPGFELVSWSGAFAPSGTPDAIVEKLNAAMVKVGQRPEFQAKLVSMGVDPDVLPTPAFAKQIAAEIPKWKSLTEMTGVAATK